MKKILLLIISLMMTTVSYASQEEHAGHDHGKEGSVHQLGHVSIDRRNLQVILHGEITPGKEAAIGIEAENGKVPDELRAWIGVKNGRGSVKSLLRADSHGHIYGHLEVPAKLPHGSAIWLDVRTDNGRQRVSVSIPETDHEHGDH